jgi:hypothetical protein
VADDLRKNSRLGSILLLLALLLTLPVGLYYHLKSGSEVYSTWNQLVVESLADRVRLEFLAPPRSGEARFVFSVPVSDRYLPTELNEALTDSMEKRLDKLDQAFSGPDFDHQYNTAEYFWFERGATSDVSHAVYVQQEGRGGGAVFNVAVLDSSYFRDAFLPWAFTSFTTSTQPGRWLYRKIGENDERVQVVLVKGEVERDTIIFASAGSWSGKREKNQPLWSEQQSVHVRLISGSRGIPLHYSSASVNTSWIAGLGTFQILLQRPMGESWRSPRVDILIWLLFVLWLIALTGAGLLISRIKVHTTI